MDISIIITTYNYDKYLYDCINSCIDQDRTELDYEIIVVDDGSTDQTTEILAKSFPANFYSYKIKNSGIEKASNYGFKKAKGRYVVRVDADDSLLCNYLQTIEKYINLGYDFYYSDYNVINNKGNIISTFKLPAFDPNEIYKRGDFLATGTLFKASLLNEYKGYSTNIVNSGLENYEFILRLLNDGMIGYHISDITFNYRRHEKNISELKIAEIIENGKELFLKNNLGHFSTNQFHPYGLKV